MGILLSLPEINLKEGELKLLLAIKMLEEGLVSLGKAADIAGFSERAFVEVLLQRGIPPIVYGKEHLRDDLENT